MSETEDGNKHDEHTVVVMKNGQVVSHVPRSISKVSWLIKVSVHTEFSCGSFLWLRLGAVHGLNVKEAT